jgi:hypothetical protein
MKYSFQLMVRIGYHCPLLKRSYAAGSCLSVTSLPADRQVTSRQQLSIYDVNTIGWPGMTSLPAVAPGMMSMPGAGLVITSFLAAVPAVGPVRV